MSGANRVTKCRVCGARIRFTTWKGKHVAENLDGSLHEHQEDA